MLRVQKGAWPCKQVSLGPLCFTIIRVTLVFPQVWNQTEPEPTADSVLSLCFLKTAGVWVPPMYLWVLGPIYLLYIHRHGKGYLRMSSLFKTKMVATASEPGSRQWLGGGWGGAGWSPKWTFLLSGSTKGGKEKGTC